MQMAQFAAASPQLALAIHFCTYKATLVLQPHPAVLQPQSGAVLEHCQCSTAALNLIKTDQQILPCAAFFLLGMSSSTALTNMMLNLKYRQQQQNKKQH
jgi:hypothetical protein